MKKLTALVLITAMILAAFTGCAKTSDDQSNEQTGQSNSNPSDNNGSSAAAKDTIVIGISAEAPTLDPQNTTAHQARQVYCNIYDNLLDKDDNGDFIPMLAEEWSVSEDGLEYTFKLNQGIMFHNGEELKASDVKYTFERGIESPHVAFFYESFDRVEAVDDYNVIVKLKSPLSILPEIMTLPQTGIVSKKAVEEFGEDYGRNPVGTGPYKFDSWVSGDSINLVSYDGYFKGAAPIKNCKFRIITDKNTGVISLEKGEVDIYYDMSAVDKQNVIDNPKLNYDEIGSISYEHVIINNEKDKLSNKKVRQALACAIDKESVLIAANNGVGVLADGQIPQNMFGYSDKVKAYEYDPQKAMDLLTEAGYPDGFDCTIKVNSGYREKTAQVIQANLADIGINLTIEVVEWGTLLGELGEGNFEISLVGKNLQLDDPALTLNNSFATKFVGAGGNFYRYANAELDRMMDASFGETDTVKRRQMFEDILVILHEDVPNIPLYWSTNNIAFNNQLKGVKALPISHYKVNKMSW